MSARWYPHIMKVKFHCFAYVWAPFGSVNDQLLSNILKNRTAAPLIVSLAKYANIKIWNTRE